jgi:hypothetical protein
MATRLPSIPTAKLPPAMGPEMRKLIGRRARLTQSIRQLETRHAALIVRHAELVEELADVDARYRALRDSAAS